MTAIGIHGGLPFVTLDVSQGGATVTLQNRLLATGCSRTIFATDSVSGVGVVPDADAGLRRMVGSDGVERVVEAQADAVIMDGIRVENITVQLGTLDYGVAMDGIVGLDLLRATRATIDLDMLELRAK